MANANQLSSAMVVPWGVPIDTPSPLESLSIAFLPTQREDLCGLPLSTVKIGYQVNIPGFVVLTLLMDVRAMILFLLIMYHLCLAISKARATKEKTGE